MNNDQQLWKQIKQDNEQAFRELFDRYYHYLIVTVVNVTGDRTLAKDSAQEVFFELWKKRAHLEIKTDFKPYLRRSVLNRAFNFIKIQKRFTDEEAIPSKVSNDISAQKGMEVSELQAQINKAIEALPERCRMVFTLCRLEGFSHKEIAEQMSISTKTVEHQMTKALKALKSALKTHSSGISLLILSLIEHGFFIFLIITTIV